MVRKTFPVKEQERMDADREAITDLLIRYATGIDRRDWELFRSCWTDDVVADYGPLGVHTGAGALTDLMRSIHDGMGPTFHRITNIVIEQDGDRATAASYVHAVLMIVPDDTESWVDAVGRYDDDLVRTDDGWRIDRRTTLIARTLSGGPMVAGLKEGA